MENQKQKDLSPINYKHLFDASSDKVYEPFR